MTDIAHRIAATALPLVEHLPALCKALDENESVILRADPGSGKSTLVPLALMDYFGGKIIMLEPRRAAVLSIASRLAELLGEDIGARVGYAVRLERKTSEQTQIEVVTEGLLVRRMQENPSMFDRGDEPRILIFDEFHERSIHTDLAFAFALDLRRMGTKIKLVIMSATMDADKTAACIESNDKKTSVITCPGRQFPVAISYRPLPQNREAPARQVIGRECAAAVTAILLEESKKHGSGTAGDVLIFLPGRREIAACMRHLRVARRLKEHGLDADFIIEELHGSLPLAQQRNIIAPKESHKRRVILATNVAETGLTIPGITTVIDSGYARIQRFHIPSGMNRLSLEQISCYSAEQRAGRAGRLGPGRCIRLWAPEEQLLRETPAEVNRIDIAAAVLECLIWGVKHPAGLPWLEPPPEAAWNRALELLRELGAADSAGNPTETGRQIARLGLDPRLGRLCIAGTHINFPLACTAAALLAERSDSGSSDPDFLNRLSELHANAGAPWTRRIIDNAGDLLRRLGVRGTTAVAWTAFAELGKMIITAFPDRIAKVKTGDTHSGERVYRFPSGREAKIAASFAPTDWLCALEVDSGERMGFIRLAVAVSEDTALQALEKQIVTEKIITWNKLKPRLIETKKAGHILLGEHHRPCSRDELLPALSSMLAEQGLKILPWDENKSAARNLLYRIRFFAGKGDRDSAHWDDAALIAGAERWLGPYIIDGDIITGEGLCSALCDRLGWGHTQEMDKLVPMQFLLPSGRKRPIDYSSGEPCIRLRLQEAFGISGGGSGQHLCIMGMPVVFHLLSPADRPIQITRDLGGFWAGSYAEVRKEMRGRYPKHKWPENPV
ncbi:MAG: ATP-dependent helicase HrpB [Treponema sp.]|nr:ATP-dependent helicase HrpB [Treponema sp.]